jgi:hypothetical protein
MGDYDNVLIHKIICITQKRLVALYTDELVRLCPREGIVEPGRLADADAYGLETLLARTMKNLQAAVRADDLYRIPLKSPGYFIYKSWR